MRSLPMITVVLLALVAAGAPLAGQTEPARETRMLFDYDQTAALDVREVRTEDAADHRLVDLTYASPDGGRVPAYLFVPEGEGPHAGLLLMHGLPGSRENLSRLGARYARTGAVVLVISAPFARPDGPRDNAVTFTEQDRREQIQLIKDLRRGVDLLLAQPTVDPERIGYVGGSYGGAMGGLLAGVEKRITAYALFVGDGGLIAHFTGPEDADGRLARLPEEQRQAWLETMAPIEPIRWVGHAAPSRLLFQQGLHDRAVPPADGRAYAEAGSDPKTIKWYDQGHGLGDEMLADQVAWLAEWIGIDASRFE